MDNRWWKLWILKTEMFYDQEDNYKHCDLIKAIDTMGLLYNYDRIKVKLQDCHPLITGYNLIRNYL